MGLFSKILGSESKISNEELNKKFSKILIPDEVVEMGFELLRDTYLFTDRRLILVDVQGLTGSKVEYKSLPYKNISQFLLETAGTFDLDAELKIWISSENLPTINKKFNKNIDVYNVQRFLAEKTL